jgi:RNA polymerase sigma factor (sigma-70 family)
MSQDEAVEMESRRLLDSEEPPARQKRHAQLERLLREHNDALINYVYGWVHSRSDAKDIVQEAYCRIFRLEDPTALSHFRGYLYRTAKNIAADWLRRRVVREAFVEEQPLRAAREAPSCEQVWLAREEMERVQSAVEELGKIAPKTKMALLMIKEEGLSYEEVAAKLGIKTRSAHRLVQRAMEYLVEAVSRERTAREDRT